MLRMWTALCLTGLWLYPCLAAASDTWPLVNVQEKYGWNPQDMTPALQAAIDDYGGGRGICLRIEKMDSDWVLGQVYLKSNVQIEFDDKVVVQGKSHAFHVTTVKGGNGPRSMFNIWADLDHVSLKGYGATIQMHKEEYPDQDPNTDDVSAESHCVYIYESRHIQVLGLTLKDAYGDGVVISGWAPGSHPNSMDVTIKDVTCDGNYRQGISVEGVDGLLIENCAQEHAGGLSRAAGRHRF